MYVKTQSASLEGLDARLIEVEVDISNGLPAFNIVGLADKSINESKDRICVGMKACDFPPPPKRIVVNLAPANVKKEGPQLDLAIAAALLVSFEYIKCAPEFMENFCFFGELSLTGKLKPVKGMLPLALQAIESKAKYMVVSLQNSNEASLAKLDDESNIELIVIKDLKDLKEIIETLYKLDLNKKEGRYQASLKELQDCKSQYIAKEIKIESLFLENSKLESDYSEVIGQSQAKRGLEIAAAGRHHCLMIGPPGCGKSMLAKRFIDLMPNLSFKEALEVTKIYSVSGLLKEALLSKAQLRAPHHSATVTSLVGGGVPPKPGEASLAHHGVLFLDELTEFNRFLIDQFRQILENKEITLNKSNRCFSYPADFTLIAACNPCPCGYLGDSTRACACSPSQISRYISRLSGPFLDRVDIHLQLSKLSKEEMALLSSQYSDTNPINSLSTKEMKSNIQKARVFRKSRQQNHKKFSEKKEESDSITKVIKHELHLEKESRDFLNEAINSLNMSARSHQKILKISRTIADLSESEVIKLDHVAEALQYRSLNWDQYIQSSSQQGKGCFETSTA